MFSSPPKDGVNPFVFPIAAYWARRSRLHRDWFLGSVRFFLLAPEAIEFELVPLIRVDEVYKLQTSLLVCRGRRWFGAKWSDTLWRTFGQVIDDEASFKFFVPTP